MALLFAEGFTLTPQETTQYTVADSPLRKMGWELTEQNIAGTATFCKFVVTADNIFPTRNRLQMGAFTNTSGSMGARMVHRFPADQIYDKIVVGMVARFHGNTTTARMAFYPGFGSINMVKHPSSTASPEDLNEGYFLFTAAANAGAAGTINTPMGTIAVSAPWNTKLWPDFYFEQDADYFIEYFLERDTGRIRMYVDGSLKVDYQYAGTKQEDMTKGFTIWMGGNPLPNDCYAYYSNIYAIGIDDVHTGPLGPATRVLEVAPTGDIQAEFSRPDSFASNADVMGQYVNTKTPSYLTAGNPGQTDVYEAPVTVGANANKVYAAGLKVSAQSFTPGEHSLVGVTEKDGTIAELEDEAALKLATPEIHTMDMTINPMTNAIWTPAELSSVGFGVRLKK